MGEIKVLWRQQQCMAEQQATRQRQRALERPTGAAALMQQFETSIAAVHEQEQMNPLSSKYVGQVEHRRRVEAVHGKLKKFGSPNMEAMDRALPGQLDTALNTLRFLDALNCLVARELVDVTTRGDAHGVPFGVLLDWREGALLQRFSSAAQYLRSAKRFGLLAFDGEYPHSSTLLESRCVGCTRKQLLDHALLLPQYIVPSMTAEGDAAKLASTVHADTRLVPKVDDFLGGSFDEDIGYVLSVSPPTVRAAEEGEASTPESRASSRSPSPQQVSPAGGRRSPPSWAHPSPSREERPWWENLLDDIFHRETQSRDQDDLLYC